VGIGTRIDGNGKINNGPNYVLGKRSSCSFKKTDNAGDILAEIVSFSGTNMVVEPNEDISTVQENVTIGETTYQLSSISKIPAQQNKWEVIFLSSPVQLSYRLEDDDTATLAQEETDALRAAQFSGLVQAYRDAYILPVLWPMDDIEIVQNNIAFMRNINSLNPWGGYYFPEIFKNPPGHVFDLRTKHLVSQDYWGSYILTCYQPATSHAKNAATDSEMGDLDPDGENTTIGTNKSGDAFALLYAEVIREFSGVPSDWGRLFYVAAHEVGHQFGLKDWIKVVDGKKVYDNDMGIMGGNLVLGAKFCEKDKDLLRTNIPAGAK